jgi:hypothetical protein
MAWLVTLRRLLPGVLSLGVLSLALLGLGAPGVVGPVGLLAGTAAAIGVLLIAVLTARPGHRRGGGRGTGLTTRMLRCRADRTGTPRLTDHPDAPGRSRPRAPSTAHAAA